MENSPKKTKKRKTRRACKGTPQRRKMSEVH